MANIFTIKIGSPATPSLMEGELGFHTGNNILYIGTNDKPLEIGGAGAFISSTAESVTLKKLQLEAPLAPAYGGTGVNNLSDLRFTISQISDFNTQDFLTADSLTEIGFAKNGENWSLNINSLSVNGKEAATQEWVNNQSYLKPNSSGLVTYTYNGVTQTLATQQYVNDHGGSSAPDTSNFVLKTGDTMTGKLLLSTTPNLYFKNETGPRAGEISTGSLGYISLIAKGDNEDRRELRINSPASNSNNNSSLELIINNSNFYNVYHSGWTGTMSAPRFRASDGYMYISKNAQTVMELGIFSDVDNGYIALSDTGHSNWHLYRFEPNISNFKARTTYYLYSQRNIIYSETDPISDTSRDTLENGAIWLKPV